MKITIPKPCHENWDLMTSTEKGRFCAVCSKVVRDFSDCSDEEIYDDLKSNPNICGRFTDKQINKNIGFSVLSKIALGLLISGTATLANAQKVEGNDINKLNFKKGLDAFRIVNDTINRSHWLGEPSQKDIESTQPKIFIDGKRINENKLKRLKPSNIKSVEILSGTDAKKTYGKLGEYGVILIESKKEE